MPTFVKIVTREMLAALVDSYIDQSKGDNGGLSAKVGSFFKSVTGKAVIGRDAEFAEKKQGIMKRYLTGSKSTAMGSMRSKVGENVPALVDYPDFIKDEETQEKRKLFDAEIRKMYEDHLGKYLEKPMQALFSEYSKDIGNEGKTPEMLTKALQKINDVYRFCEKEGGLDLLDKEYDEDDAVHRFAYIVLSYLIIRSDSHESLTKDKCAIVKEAYDGLKRKIKALRQDAEPGMYEETVLGAINELFRKHDEILDDAAVGFDVPLTISLVSIAKVPFKYTPGTGVLGKYLKWLSESVEAQQIEKIEQARALSGGNVTP